MGTEPCSWLRGLDPPWGWAWGGLVASATKNKPSLKTLSSPPSSSTSRRSPPPPPSRPVSGGCRCRIQWSPPPRANTSIGRPRLHHRLSPRRPPHTAAGAVGSRRSSAVAVVELRRDLTMPAAASFFPFPLKCPPPPPPEP
jgi:hypothetical protein